MSSFLDDQIRAVLNRLRVTLSGQLETELTASTDDLVRAVTHEHRHALLEAREQTTAVMRVEADQQLSAVRNEFERRRDSLERDKDGLLHQNGLLQREKEDLQREKEDLQQGTALEIAGLERTLDEIREQLDVARRNFDEVQGARESLLREVEQSRKEYENRERQLQDAIERSAREAHQTRSDADASVRQLQTMRARLAQMTRLTSAMRTLDEATSLGDILDRLAHLACQESGRTAVFLVNGTKLRGWRALGFDDGVIVGSDFEPADAGVVGQVLQLGVSRQHRDGDDGGLPSFASAGGPWDAIALPVQVGGSVIAVLYTDAAKTDKPEDPEWVDTIHAMAKHAGRVLEAMTVRQAAALWTPPAVSGRHSQAATNFR